MAPRHDCELVRCRSQRRSLSLSLHTQKTKQLANNDYLNQTKVVAGDDAELTVRTLGLPPLA